MVGMICPPGLNRIKVVAKRWLTSDSKNGYTFVTEYSSKCVTVFLNQTIVTLMVGYNTILSEDRDDHFLLLTWQHIIPAIYLTVRSTVLEVSDFQSSPWLNVFMFTTRQLTYSMLLRASPWWVCSTLQSRTGPEQGFPCVLFPYREKPVFITGFPGDGNRFFPVRKSTQGKPCFHYRDGFAV